MEKRAKLSEQSLEDLFPLKQLIPGQLPLEYSFVKGKVVLIENVASL